jgi:hypothetical protein
MLAEIGRSEIIDGPRNMARYFSLIVAGLERRLFFAGTEIEAEVAQLFETLRRCPGSG